MKQTIKRLSILLFALIFSGMILPCMAQTKTKDDLIEIYDGGQLFAISTNRSREDIVFVQNAIKNQEAGIKQQAEEFAGKKCVMNPLADTVLDFHETEFITKSLSL